MWSGEVASTTREQQSPHIQRRPVHPLKPDKARQRRVGGRVDDGLETSALLVCVARLGCNSTDDTPYYDELLCSLPPYVPARLVPSAVRGRRRRLQHKRKAGRSVEALVCCKLQRRHNQRCNPMLTFLGTSLIARRWVRLSSRRTARSTAARSGAPPLSLAESLSL